MYRQMIKELVPKVLLFDQSPRTNPQCNVLEGSLKDYVIINRLVMSGQAMLYLASKSGRLYVLKVYEQTLKNQKIYENEVQILKKLEHPGIIHVEQYLTEVEFYNQFEAHTSTCCLFSMPYKQNGDILQWVMSKTPFEENCGRYVIMQILSTFRYLQKKNIFHRDVKPQNILIGDDFKPLLIDFGLSVDGKYATRGFVGSSRCAAPQIIKEKQYTLKSQIYSLGIVLFFALTGQYPYTVARITDANYRLLFEKKYKQFWSNFGNKSRIVLSDSFKDLFVSMVHHDPIKRPSLDDILEFEWLKSNVATEDEYLVYMKQKKEGSLFAQL